MIDKTQPPPGRRHEMFREEPTGALERDGVATPVEAHHIYAEVSRHAVVVFAERIAAWLVSAEANTEYAKAMSCGSRRIEWDIAQILAAARGERSLP